MKKSLKIRIVVLLMANICFCSANSQQKTENILQEQIGSVRCVYQKVYTIGEASDTFYMAFLTFQDAKFKMLTSRASITLFAKSKIGMRASITESLIKDLRAAELQMDKKSTIYWEQKDYQVYVYDFTKTLYLESRQPKNTGYTELTKKEVPKLIKWLEGLHVFEDNVNLQ